MASIELIRATEQHLHYAVGVSALIAQAAQDKDSGLAHRTVAFLEQKIREGKAIIALSGEEVAGFCYIDLWQDGQFVAHSGLIVSPKFRGQGLAEKIKKAVFDLSRDKYPDAKIFGLTTSGAVMKINNSLGYKAVPYNEITADDRFWKGCESCANFDILTRMGRKVCLCTAMVWKKE